MSGLQVTGTAVVIGSASGIGKAVALAFARYGALGLVVADLNEPGVQETARQARQVATNPEFSVTAYHVDVRDYETVERLFRAAKEQYGRIDYSVSTAGIYTGQGLLAGNPLDLYDNVQNTNAKGILHHTKAAISVMLTQEVVVKQGNERSRTLGRGSIVNVCSVAGLIGMPGSIEYNASKFAAVGITKTAANEYGASQIRINAVCPGPIQTPLLERALASQAGSRSEWIDATSLNRFGDVDEVADTILFLASPAGSYVHGTALVVDGGVENRGPAGALDG